MGCVLLEVDDHLMGGLGKAHHESMERLRQKIKFGKWHRLTRDGPSFFGRCNFSQLPARSFKVDMTRFFPRAATTKDLSDANRAVNRCKQTEDAGLLIQSIPLVNLRTVSFSDAALDLDRPDGSRQGGFMFGFTTPELHQQGSAAMSPTSWRSHKVK